jgi:hypothetical protein
MDKVKLEMKTARPLQAIKLKCYDCSGWNNNEVKLCPHVDCILWPLRFGKKPKRIKYSKITMKEYQKRIRGV